ncbi:hypothetical protein QZM46_07555 [Burkholderia vietnamiensis]|uniref:Transmembrane protein n=1 Tax=Burkholderia vietnamiensis TaxID=60552 RepID=A0AAW7T8M5_BURVI|nr:hypothetical protein [Burkholderia vietnamiensis]MBH9645752.1 hypothetical protein [Burkholderia vietnamiensis]MBR8008241.1 hypothetical protein [Burkholderia vietnamiensis]MDN7551205.1 hypothetical protein [Burkholderia vietnamiensis]MDN7798512.1 hypothetical protein [Burkholderia vietnamiensis]MDN8043379.1 hypothetical protein [Burkholderia vietnamiensis]
MALTRSIPDWPAKRRALRHLVFSIVTFSIAYWLYALGNWQRSAAHAGDRRILGVRQAIRATLHSTDAVSVLEHALSGVGMAFVGIAVLQIYYFAYQPPRANDVELPRWGRVLLFALTAAAVAAIVWPLAYGHTGFLVVVAVWLVIGWWLARPDQISQLAFDAPSSYIALVGGLMWLNFDLGWKLHQWPITRDTAGVVLAHLLASSGTLVACSAAAGAATQRCAWLRPSEV